MYSPLYEKRGWTGGGREDNLKKFCYNSIRAELVYVLICCQNLSPTVNMFVNIIITLFWRSFEKDASPKVVLFKSFKYISTFSPASAAPSGGICLKWSNQIASQFLIFTHKGLFAIPIRLNLDSGVLALLIFWLNCWGMGCWEGAWLWWDDGLRDTIPNVNRTSHSIGPACTIALAPQIMAEFEEHTKLLF